ncbi:hypothetical protein NITGR_590060 [Nitrospina gracilis 3/211]|uniref:Uncharacterized protein n=1 Tax=Nitrospina gracilis (strain 3/211) TaxID=1266370 RepID=M1YL55_NITG3|nr:hypothetical protein [Nitrospina gracilis]CCQ91181.1 hypothetical protein NITGR_590060 [Nitrospina gracilis 3/211]
MILKGKDKIGIELTKLYCEKGNVPEAEQKQIKLRESIVAEAQKLYQSQGGKGFELTFSFNRANPIESKNKKKLIKKLSELARNIEGFSGGDLPSQRYSNIPELDYAYLNKNEYPDPTWRIVTLTEGSELSKNDLLAIVREKEEKAKGYEKCDLYWLLVTVDFFDPVQDREFPRNDFDKIESEVFDKIFVYRTTGEVLEVK